MFMFVKKSGVVTYNPGIPFGNRRTNASNRVNNFIIVPKPAPPQGLPEIISFELGASVLGSNSIPVVSLQGNDVTTAFFISESNIPPEANDPGWTSTVTEITV